MAEITRRSFLAVTAGASLVAALKPLLPLVRVSSSPGLTPWTTVVLGNGQAYRWMRFEQPVRIGDLVWLDSSLVGTATHVGTQGWVQTRGLTGIGVRIDG
jgi:hypothetical protein